MGSNLDLIFSYGLNAIILNEKLNIYIGEIVGNLTRQIDSLRDSQDYLLSQVKHEDDLYGNYVSQILNGKSMRQIKKPYFISKLGLTPYTTETVMRKERDGSLDFYAVKGILHKLCFEREFEILKASISRSICDIECKRLLRSKVKDHAEDIHLLKKMSVTELLRRCNSKMIDKIDWLLISCDELINRISREDCRSICEKSISTEYVYTAWSPTECEQLISLVSKYGCQGHWVEISARLTIKRQPIHCFKEWLKLRAEMETHEEWNLEEDELLCDEVKNANRGHGYYRDTNWNAISFVIPNRFPKDCEKRWKSIQVSICNRPFTEVEDYEMLLLIKRHGCDNWTDIISEMDQRSVEECQRRFCILVNEAYEWTYIEDRRLWLLLRPYFRELWEEDQQALYPTKDLAIYKNVMKAFRGRYPIVIRYRYGQLCKWFQLWNQFFIETQTKKTSDGVLTISLLSDTPEENQRVIANFKQILVNSTFFPLVREAFRDIGSNDPDREANELITMVKSGCKEVIGKLIDRSRNKKLENLMCSIHDMKDGIFIPLKFEDYVDRSCHGLKYPERAADNVLVQMSNVRIIKSKIALSITLRRIMKRILTQDPVDDTEKECILKLHNCEGTFSSALSHATADLEKTQNFKISASVETLVDFLPAILAGMVEYVQNQEAPKLSSYGTKLKSDGTLCSKREEIAQLLIYRDTIPSIYKTHLSPKQIDGGLIMKHVPQEIAKNLTKKESLVRAKENILRGLRLMLKHPPGDPESGTTDIPLLTPDSLKFNFLRSLLLQKTQLLNQGQNEFITMVRLRYDNPVDHLRDDTNFKVALSADWSSLYLRDPRYLLLRSRLLSVVSLAAVAARICPSECALIGDQLHEEQNGATSSTRVSEFCLTIRRPRDRPEQAQLPSTRASRQNRKRRLPDLIEEGWPTQSKEDSAITKIVDNQPLTRSTDRDWAKLYAADCDRSFFIPKHVLLFVSQSDFEIESINGVNVDIIRQWTNKTK